MNILQYSIGIYPDRQGGLVRYSTDLAKEEAKSNKVFYLYPGKLGLVDKKVRIKFVHAEGNLNIYKIDNALPIPLFGGVLDPTIYTRKIDRCVYTDFLKQEKIEIIHIHSLMGLHLELLKAANDLNIPVIMTTHDYYGICLNTTLYKENQVCDNREININCAECSLHAHSYTKLAIGQSQWYKTLKKNKIVANLRKKELLSDGKERDLQDKPLVTPDYTDLNKYYKNEFFLIDFYIFNSLQTKQIFISAIGEQPNTVVNIIHSDIKDRRKKRDFFRDGKLHVGFMGECTDFKGFPLLHNAISQLNQSGCKIVLDVFNDYITEDEVTVRRGRFSKDKLEEAYNSVDLVAVPSKWYETLSFIAIESISCGTPCLVSDHVGAKDIIQDGVTGFICGTTVQDIKKYLNKIYNNHELLIKCNCNILESDYLFDFEEQTRSVIDIYKRVMDGYLYEKK